MSFVTTGSIGGPGDTSLAHRVRHQPPRDSTPACGVVRRGNIGTDGSFVIGPNDVDLFRVTLTGPATSAFPFPPPEGKGRRRCRRGR